LDRSGIAAECILPPTHRCDPPLARHGHGKLVALLALQSLPLFCENPVSNFRFREFLGCWNPVRSRDAQIFVESVLEARSRQVLEEVWAGTDRCFARGVEVILEIDESRLPGRSAYLFANVLERFLSLTSSINCFTRLIVRSSETRNILHRSPARAGNQVLASLT
jgi:type VI secretion system protein ImpG